LTPANEAALRAFPAVPVVGQLHGTELALLRAIEAGAPAGWRFAGRWAARQRQWAEACERLIVPPGAAVEVARLLGVPLERVQALPSGVELELFERRPRGRRERLLHWRRWLVDEPLGWDESGTPGTVAYREADLWPFRQAEAILLYVGRYTAVKRLPLLIGAHARALERLGRPLPLILVGGHPGEWEGQHPLAAAHARGNDQVFLAGWRPHGVLPQALNAADLLVLPSVAEAFGLVLIEAMSCGLPVIAAEAHGPAEIVAAGTGWLVPPDAEGALADALVTAASDAEERRRRGARAYRHSHLRLAADCRAHRRALCRARRRFPSRRPRLIIAAGGTEGNPQLAGYPRRVSRLSRTRSPDDVVWIPAARSRFLTSRDQSDAALPLLFVAKAFS
jgi:glycosyltransferase involved in cell wall biosynthesis